MNALMKWLGIAPSEKAVALVCGVCMAIILFIMIVTVGWLAE